MFRSFWQLQQLSSHINHLARRGPLRDDASSIIACLLPRSKVRVVDAPARHVDGARVAARRHECVPVHGRRNRGGVLREGSLVARPEVVDAAVGPAADTVWLTRDAGVVEP